MTEMTFAQALALGLTECLDADPRVTLINSSYGGLTSYRTTFNVLREKYADRITDTPISELGYCGIAVGAAMTGLRPIVALSTAAFSFEAWPQIVNEAPNIFYMSDGQVKVPLMFHALVGIRLMGAAQHSARPQAMLMQAAGLQIIAPALASDVKPLLQAAKDSQRPTFWVDHALLFEEPLSRANAANPPPLTLRRSASMPR